MEIEVEASDLGFTIAKAETKKTMDVSDECYPLVRLYFHILNREQSI